MSKARHHQSNSNQSRRSFPSYNGEIGRSVLKQIYIPEIVRENAKVTEDNATGKLKIEIKPDQKKKDKE